MVGSVLLIFVSLFCVVRLFCFCVLFVLVLCLVPNVACVSGLSIHGGSFGFLERLLRENVLRTHTI